MLVETPTKDICKIEGLEEYKFYFVTIDGDVFSRKYLKIRKIKPCWSNGKKSYQIVKLTNGKGKAKSFYVHQLICRAFLPNPTNSYGVRHLDGDVTNNALSNLEWLGRKREIDGNIELDTDRLVLSKDLSDYIKLVHLSAIKKNIPVPDTYEFFHAILNESLTEYVNRFGLKKTMYLLENSCTSL
jgi:hypothetical protein